MTRTELLAASARGMSFGTEMVQALLGGNKSRTMRVIKPQPEKHGSLWMLGGAGWSDAATPFSPVPGHSLYNRMRHKVGDIVYVRETFAEDRCDACEGAPAALRGPCVVGPCLRGYVYRADGEKPEGWEHALAGNPPSTCPGPPPGFSCGLPG